jgi:peptidoglycan/LPS O-acetylase OafA/YrhL
MSASHRTSSDQAAHNFPVLDGLRAISILLVLACHLLPLGPKALRFNETAGAMGMSLFFALSGFLITTGLIKNQNIREFMIRRLARILPLAYAYTIVVFLFLSFDPKALLWTDLFLVNYLTQYLNDWNGHFWSLCVEMHFYLAIAFVVLVAGRKGLWVVWPACLAITLLRVSAGEYLAIKTHLRVDEILSGACVAMLYHNGFRIRGSLAIIAVAALLWALSAWPSAYAAQYFRPYTTAFMLFASIYYGVANTKTVLASRPLRYIATISYALYVIHPATAHGWMNEGDPITRYLLKRPISFALTFILAHISTFYWESLWQSAARRWLKRRRSMNSSEIAGAPTTPLR